MAVKITQPIASGAYAGRRYGSFALKLQSIPDFLHGAIDIGAYLSGTITVRSHLSGKLSVGTHLLGDIRMNQ